MGYMGLGMQKWIYTMRPRQPFSMKRKKAFTVVPKYERVFKIQPSKHKDHLHIGIIVFIVIVFILLTLIPQWMEYARIRHKQEVTHTTTRDNQFYAFLKKSGEKQFVLGNYEKALSEFKLARNIRPNSEEINLLLLEVIGMLCDENISYCQEYDTLKF